MQLSNFPKELIHNRSTIEGLFIFCLWKEPKFYEDYMDSLVARDIENLKTVRSLPDIITKDGEFYYSLGLELFKRGYKSFTDASIYSYLEDKKGLRTTYEEYGGYSQIERMVRIVDEDNIDTYYDNLLRNNILLNYHLSGDFNVLTNLEKFKKMSSSQVCDYFEYRSQSVSLNRISNVEIVDLDLDDQWIKECEDGLEMGISFASKAPLLNYHTLGIHQKNVNIFASTSGKGKTSFITHTYILPVLDSGENVTIVANEQNIKDWKHLFLATILSQKINYYKLVRKKVKQGSFLDKHGDAIKKAQEYFRKHYYKRIKFAKIYNYDIGTVCKIFKSMSKRGFKYGVYDTFKAENASSKTMIGDLIEHSKKLLQTAEKEDLAITITMQVAIYMENIRYMTANCLSNSKQVKEVVSELILMRELWEDEYTDEKYDVKPYKFKRDDSGKYTNIKEIIELDPNKVYRIIFLDKTRNDGGGVCLLYEFKGAWNEWVELGYCNVKHQR